MSAVAANLFAQEEESNPRVLLVDSNKGNRHLLAAQLSTGPGLEVDITSTFADTERRLQQGSAQYFVAVVNVKLKDAPDGSIVDLLNSASIPVIAFSLQDDREMRKKIVNKFVLDYIYIKSRQHFEHIENLV
ncbi:MAG: hypothetical protein AAF420_16510, partial [Pseudomonadota bacterium]